jgi:hypothetical protein
VPEWRGNVFEGDVLAVMRRFFKTHSKKNSNGEHHRHTNPNDSLTLVPFLLLKIRRAISIAGS